VVIVAIVAIAVIVAIAIIALIAIQNVPLVLLRKDAQKAILNVRKFQIMSKV
jgi:hypothetical protein